MNTSNRQSLFDHKQALYNIKKDCFWDYDFEMNDIMEIANGTDYSRKEFLFGKIMQNSTRLLESLSIFSAEDLKNLLSAYCIPGFQASFLTERKEIVAHFYFGQPLKYSILAWH